jgi:hypothetical protein
VCVCVCVRVCGVRARGEGHPCDARIYAGLAHTFFFIKKIKKGGARLGNVGGTYICISMAAPNIYMYNIYTYIYVYAPNIYMYDIYMYINGRP